MVSKLQQAVDAAARPAVLYGLAVFALAIMAVHAAFAPAMLTVEGVLALGVAIGMAAGIASHQTLEWTVLVCGGLSAMLVRGR